MVHVTTYHCICTQLLLATPYSLPALPQRRHDHARILQLGKPPAHIGEPQEDSAHDASVTTRPESSKGDGQGEQQSAPLYSFLLNTTLDRRAVIVRREDGFEKRWIRRCARCKTGVGYVLAEPEGEAGPGEVVYLLEDGMVETSALAGSWTGLEGGD